MLTTTPGPFGPTSAVVASLLPARLSEGLRAEPSGLWEALWRVEVAAGRLETVHTDAEVVDCGTPRSYLAANMAWVRVHGATGPGGSVVGEGAVVEGELTRCVVWPASRVGPTEHLVDAIRAERHTVLVR